MNKLFENGLTIEERNKLVLENDWVINALIKKYYHISGVDLDDMRSEAHVMMCRGAETYEAGKSKPSTHLYNWARAGILNYLAEKRVVHIPRNKINEQIQMNKVELDVNRSRIVQKEIPLDNYSIDSGDENRLYQDKIQKQVLDTITADPVNIYGDTELSEHIEFVLDKEDLLSPIERFTIIHRYGLKGEERKTLTQTASLTASVFGKKYTEMGLKKAQDRALLKLREDEDLEDAFV